MSQYGKDFWKLYGYAANMPRAPQPTSSPPRPSPQGPPPGASLSGASPSGILHPGPGAARSSQAPVVPAATIGADPVGFLTGLSVALWIAAIAMACPAYGYGSDELRAVLVAVAAIAALRLIQTRIRHLHIAGAQPVRLRIGRAKFAALLLAAVTLHAAAGAAPLLPALLDGNWSDLRLGFGDLMTASPDLDVLLSPFAQDKAVPLVSPEQLLAAATDLCALATFLLAMTFRARDAGFFGVRVLLLLCVPPLSALLLLAVPSRSASAKP